MITAQLLLSVALLSAPMAPNDNSTNGYWNGYGAAVVAPSVVGTNADVIHEGKNKPKFNVPAKQEEPKPILPPAVDVPKAKEPEPKVIVKEVPVEKVVTKEVIKEVIPNRPLTMDEYNKLIAPKGFRLEIIPLAPPPTRAAVAPAKEQVATVPNTPPPAKPVPVQPAPAPATPPVVRDQLPLPQSYEELLNYCKQGHTRALMVFSASWCPHCPGFKRDTIRNPQVQQYLANQGIGIVQHFDVDNNPSVSQAFGANPLPYYVVIDGEHIIKRGSGAVDPQTFMNWVPKK